LVPRVKRKSRWPGLAGWVLAIALGFPALRLALGEPRSDKEVAEQILANMAVGSPAASSSATAPPSVDLVARSPLEEARRALDRAAGARRSGDIRHAELLEGLARECAETARDVVRAAQLEADAGALEVAAADAGLRAERARALLEESIARRGRAEAELGKLSADGGLFPTKPPPASSARPKSAKGNR
jgi:hypothetical protein